MDHGAETQIDAPKETTLSSAPVGAMAVKRPASVRLERAKSLYMPPSVKTTYSSLYSDTEIGAGAGAAASLVQKAIASGSKKGVMGAAKDMLKDWKSGAQTLGDAGLVTAFNCAKGIEQIGGPLLGMQGAIAAAQHTTAPINIAPAAPVGDPAPKSRSKNREEKRIVAIVTPDMGLLDEPTIPAI